MQMPTEITEEMYFSCTRRIIDREVLDYVRDVLFIRSQKNIILSDYKGSP